MAAMERLLAAGSPVEPSAEELAHENVAVKMVQREMSEADEANLLEEEGGCLADMHVFDREPLADRLPLVSCNACKKPIKASQYSAHAERCRSFSAADDTVTEIDGGANHKKPPRKARKKLLVAQDNVATAGERERLQSLDADDAALPDSVGTSAGDSHDQHSGRPGFANSRGQKNGSSSAEDGSGAGTGTTSALYSDGLLSPAKRDLQSGAQRTMLQAPQEVYKFILKHKELDRMCGVLTEQGAPCRQPLTCKVHSESTKRAVTGRRRPYDVLLQELKASHNRLRSSKVHDSEEFSGVGPLPMTTKVYYLRHHHRMRAVLGNLFREACARDSSSSPSPNSLSSEHGAPTTVPALSLDNSVLEALQQTGQFLASDKVVDQDQGHPGGLLTTPGTQNQVDRKFSATGTFTPNGQFAYGKGRSGSPLLGAVAGGVLGNGPQPPPFGGVSVT